jgi:ribosome-binding ATPase
MKLGIIGLPQAGKTTIYNAVTKGDVPTTMSGKMEVNTAVVDVPDPRVDKLIALYNPKKSAYAKVTFADIAGLDGSGQGNISGALRNELGLMDGFVHVVRSFDDESVMHVSGSVDAIRDIEAMEGELLINDLIAIENKLEKLEGEWAKGGKDKKIVEREQVLFKKLLDTLSEDIPLRNIDLSELELGMMTGFQFLTIKPMLVIINKSEGQEELDVSAVSKYAKVISLQGQLEMEISQLPDDEAEIFLAEYGIEEPSLFVMIREAYELLGLHSFFTVGEDEVRAWTVRIGAAAPEAAGVIHTDLQKGFIRAEIMSFADLIEFGSELAVKEAGKFRVEGKTYVVQDGEIVHVRFNL